MQAALRGAALAGPRYLPRAAPRGSVSARVYNSQPRRLGGRNADRDAYTFPRFNEGEDELMAERADAKKWGVTRRQLRRARQKIKKKATREDRQLARNLRNLRVKRLNEALGGPRFPEPKRVWRDKGSWETGKPIEWSSPEAVSVVGYPIPQDKVVIDGKEYPYLGDIVEVWDLDDEDVEETIRTGETLSVLKTKYGESLCLDPSQWKLDPRLSVRAMDEQFKNAAIVTFPDEEVLMVGTTQSCLNDYDNILLRFHEMQGAREMQGSFMKWSLISFWVMTFAAILRILRGWSLVLPYKWPLFKKQLRDHGTWERAKAERDKAVWKHRIDKWRGLTDKPDLRGINIVDYYTGARADRRADAEEEERIAKIRRNRHKAGLDPFPPDPPTFQA